MKKVAMIVLASTMLIACAKDHCVKCVATVSYTGANIPSATAESMTCGLSAKEASAQSGTTSTTASSGSVTYTTTTVCTKN